MLAQQLWNRFSRTPAEAALGGDAKSFHETARSGYPLLRALDTACLVHQPQKQICRIFQLESG